MAAQTSLEGVLGQLLELYQGLIDVAKRAPAEQLDKNVLRRILDLEKRIDGLVKAYEIEPQYIAEKDKDLIPTDAENVGERVLRVDQEYQIIYSGHGMSNSTSIADVDNAKGCTHNIRNEFIRNAIQEAKKFQADFVYNPSIVIEGSYSREGDWIENEGFEHFGVFTAEGRIVLYKAR